MKYKKELSKLHIQVQGLYHRLDDDDKKKFNLRRKLDRQLLTMLAFRDDYYRKYERAKQSLELFDSAFKKTIKKWESKYSNG